MGSGILGAKKPAAKLGVKKISADLIDFDEAEKKAKEEAERIEKLGYDPEAEEEKAAKKAEIKTNNIITPAAAPVSSSSSRSAAQEKSAAEVERLGMGVRKLGFGMVGKPGGAGAAAGAGGAAAAKKNAGGFGSVGPIKASEGMFFLPLSLLWPSLYTSC